MATNSINTGRSLEKLIFRNNSKSLPLAAKKICYNKDFLLQTTFKVVADSMTTLGHRWPKVEHILRMHLHQNYTKMILLSYNDTVYL